MLNSAKILVGIKIIEKSDFQYIELYVQDISAQLAHHLKKLRTMTSSSLENIPSIEDYKTVLDKNSNRNKTYLETGHLPIQKQCCSKVKWFKGSKDRGFKGTLAE